MANAKAIGMANLELAMSENNQKLKDYVDSNTREVKLYQKYVNVELDSCFCTLNADYAVKNEEYVPFQKVNGTMNVQDGLITVKPGQRVQIDVAIGFASAQSSSYANVELSIRNATNNKHIQLLKFLQNNAQYEPPHCASVQYTNDTQEDCQLGCYVSLVVVSDVMVGGYSTLTVHEIGRAITIDPVEYVNATQGIEDTPVGHIISHIGTIAPKHYLVCDGSEYNIKDYPYLAQHIEDVFGSINFFGGDGEATFAVPKLAKTNGEVSHADVTPVMTSNTSPSPYVVTVTSCYDGSYDGWKAFDQSTSSFWSANSNANQSLVIDMGQPILVTAISLLSKASYSDGMAKDFTIEGSNDNQHYDVLATLTNQCNWASGGETRTYDLQTQQTLQPYRYYKLNVASNNGRVRLDIAEIKLLQASWWDLHTVSLIKCEPTFYAVVKRETSNEDLALLEQQVNVLEQQLEELHAYNDALQQELSAMESILEAISRTDIDSEPIEQEGTE